MTFKGLFETPARNTVYLGAPEAEAESLANSALQLTDVYEDFHGLLSDLGRERFIIVGRKGCGKSAFAEHFNSEAARNPNVFSTFIRTNTINLEELIQLGSERDDAINIEALFSWIIYTNVLRLFVERDAVADDANFRRLKEFVRKNSGYIQITDYEIRGLINKHGFEVATEQFNRFFRGQYNRDTEIRTERAPFYKLIPHLEQTLLDALSSSFEISNKNEYLIFVDDLDIHFKSSNQSSVDTLMKILRVGKHINEIFGKKPIRAKVIFLLRDDMAKFLKSHYTDAGKLFASYATNLHWYQDQSFARGNENALYLKRFINKRINFVFNRLSWPVDSGDPWNSLVSHFGEQFSGTTFKYVADHTLYRPRDLLLFFGPLEKGNYKYPLSKSDIHALLGQYANSLATEFGNEMLTFYDAGTITNIFDAIGEILRVSPCDYSLALTIVGTHCGEINPQALIEDLFERSVIGNMLADQRIHFKHKEPINRVEPYILDKTAKIIVHNGFKVYLTNRGK